MSEVWCSKDSRMKEPEKIELNVKETKLFEMCIGSEQVFELWLYYYFFLDPGKCVNKIN